jgi:hypothetical protein
MDTNKNLASRKLLVLSSVSIPLSLVVIIMTSLVIGFDGGTVGERAANIIAKVTLIVGIVVLIQQSYKNYKK